MAIEGGERVTQFVDLVQGLKILVENAPKSFVFSDKISLPRKDINERLITLESNMPDAVKSAAAIIEQEQTIIDRAQKEASDTVAQANSQGEAIVANARAELARLEQEIVLRQKEAQRIQAESQKNAEEIARQAQAKGDAILQQAQQQAQQLVMAAEARAKELVSQDNIYLRATKQAEDLTEKTNADMAELRRKTFAYLDDTLGQAENYVNGLVNDIRHERDSINSVR